MKIQQSFQALVQLLVFSVIVLASAGHTNAQSTPSRESLRGLHAVPVKVQVSKGAGTTPDRLREFVELRLRSAGIMVPEDNLPSRLEGHALLYLRVLSSEDGRYLSSVELSLMQDVVLKRKPSTEEYVSTWESKQFSGDEKSNEPNVKRWVAELVDSFVNDYLAVNQK